MAALDEAQPAEKADFDQSQPAEKADFDLSQVNNLLDDVPSDTSTDSDDYFQKSALSSTTISDSTIPNFQSIFDLACQTDDPRLLKKINFANVNSAILSEQKFVGSRCRHISKIIEWIQLRILKFSAVNVLQKLLSSGIIFKSKTALTFTSSTKFSLLTHSIKTRNMILMEFIMNLFSEKDEFGDMEEITHCISAAIETDQLPIIQAWIAERWDWPNIFLRYFIRVDGILSYNSCVKTHLLINGIMNELLPLIPITEKNSYAIESTKEKLTSTTTPEKVKQREIYFSTIQQKFRENDPENLEILTQDSNFFDIFKNSEVFLMYEHRSHLVFRKMVTLGYLNFFNLDFYQAHMTLLFRHQNLEMFRYATETSNPLQIPFFTQLNLDYFENRLPCECHEYRFRKCDIHLEILRVHLCLLKIVIECDTDPHLQLTKEVFMWMCGTENLSRIVTRFFEKLGDIWNENTFSFGDIEEKRITLITDFEKMELEKRELDKRDSLTQK